MKTIIHRIGIVAALAVLSTTVAFAGPGNKCSACGMALSAKKSAKTPIAVKVGKKTMYCCAGCKMEAPKPAKKK